MYRETKLDYRRFLDPLSPKRLALGAIILGLTNWDHRLLRNHEIRHNPIRIDLEVSYADWHAGYTVD